MKSEAPRLSRTYFGATWEFWKRVVDRSLWDWAVDGPFCIDPHCGQRIKPVVGNQKVWKCVRCGAPQTIPLLDFSTLRDRVIRFFEEGAREYAP